MKKFVSLMMSCILLLSLCACTAEPTLVGTVSADNTQSVEAPTTVSDKVFTLGDSVELNDVVISFVDLIESKGSKYFKPSDGNVFVACEFEIVNNSKEDLSVSSVLSFEAYCDDYACEYSISALSANNDKKQLDGTVAAGKKMKGIVAYEVPANWKELEVHYTVDILSSSEIMFVATNK